MAIISFPFHQQAIIEYLADIKKTTYRDN